MKLNKELLDQDIIPNQFWIKVDIHGNGDEWLLAIISGGVTPVIVFPQCGNFEDFVENFIGHEIVPIYKP